MLMVLFSYGDTFTLPAGVRAESSAAFPCVWDFAFEETEKTLATSRMRGRLRGTAHRGAALSTITRSRQDHRTIEPMCFLKLDPSRRHVRMCLFST